MREHILIVDDEAGIRESLTGILEDEGFETSTASSGEEALKNFSGHMPDLVMLDVWLPGMDGLETLNKIREISDVPVIIISGHGNIDMAVKACHGGAYDFMEKPLSLENVLLRVRRTLEQVRLRAENIRLKSTYGQNSEMVGKSRAMEQLRTLIGSAAPSNGRVLILGESGAGKELVARLLHSGSPRTDKPFIEVNCAAIPQELIESELFGHEKGSFTGALERKRGKFELADRGTLFLDEVGDMSLPTQAKVLRVIETQQFQRVGGSKTIKVDVRIISATNKDLELEIQKAAFREDLYYRLNVIPIYVPPLRHRKDDIQLLAAYFLKTLGAEYGRKPKKLSPSAIETLTSYNWPGNIRELKNVMERIMILSAREEVEAADIPLVTSTQNRNSKTDYFRMNTLKEARAAFETDFITARLKENAGNISRTADELGIERSNLHRKLKALDIRD